MVRKSQMEIMGLVIIVILVGLGLLFAVQLVLKKTPTSDQNNRIKESTLAAHFLNTLLSTTTSCQKRSVKELLQDCALARVVTCETGETSCAYAQSTIKSILDTTLHEWRKSYVFSIKGSSEVEKIVLSEGTCLKNKEVKLHPVPVKPGFDIVLKIELC